MFRPIASLAVLPLLASAALLAPPPAHAETYQTCAGFIDSVPAVINTQGVWCLRKDLSTAMATGNAITINTNNVTIDCNHFKLGGLAAGDATATTGILASNRQNTTVRNCNVRGFLVGVSLQGNTAGNRVEDNRLDDNLWMGIAVAGDQNLVQRNSVFSTGGAQTFNMGINADADIIDNTVSDVFTANPAAFVIGIAANGPGNTVVGNRVRNLASTLAHAAINVASPGMVLERNRIDAEFDTTGDAVRITGTGEATCIGNLSRNYADAFDDCSVVSGNIALP